MTFLLALAPLAVLVYLVPSMRDSVGIVCGLFVTLIVEALRRAYRG